MLSKYKTIYILLINVHLDCRGGVPVTRMLVGMNLSKPGMNLSKPGMNLSKPGKKHNNHVMICNKSPPPLRPPRIHSATYMRQWIRSALVQVMACRLFGTKPVLGYCQLVIRNNLQWYFNKNTKIFIHENIWKWRPFCPGWKWVNSVYLHANIIYHVVQHNRLFPVHYKSQSVDKGNMTSYKSSLRTEKISVVSSHFITDYSVELTLVNGW